MTEALVFLSAITLLAPVHNTPDGVIFRAVQVVVRSNVIEIRYQLGLNDNMIQRELRAISEPGAAIPMDAAEIIARYRDVITPQLPRQMRVTIDGSPVAIRVHRADIVRQPHRQLELVYHISFTVGATPAKFVLRDDNFQGVPGYHFAAMRARGNAAVLPIGEDKPLDRLPSAPEPGEGLSVPLEPMRGLAAYICVAGVSLTPMNDSVPALTPDQGIPTGVIVANSPAPSSTRPSPAGAGTVEPARKPEAQVPNRTLGRVIWLFSWGIAAVVIAAAWWWTSRRTKTWLLLFGFLQSPSLAAEFVEDFHASAGRQDTNGWTVHAVQSEFQAGTTEIRVLIPDGPVPAQPYATLYVLPVEAADGRHWGDAMQEIRRLDLQNRHRLVCVYPTFSHLPWYADHPQQATIRQESYFLRVVIPFVERSYPVRREPASRLLVGFSKSGWGAFSLLLRHPDVFGKAAAWDAPLAMSQPNRYGMEEIFATQENFERYRITNLLRQKAEILSAKPRLIHLGYGNFRDQHLAIESLLNELQIPHVFRDGPQRPHAWDGGWLADAVRLLVE